MRVLLTDITVWHINALSGRIIKVLSHLLDVAVTKLFKSSKHSFNNGPVLPCLKMVPNDSFSSKLKRFGMDKIYNFVNAQISDVV